MAESITGGYFVYEAGDGDAIITNYSGEDTIYIAAGDVTGYSFDDTDLILQVGEGSIRLPYMKGRAVTIMNAEGVTTSQVYGTGYSAQDVIKNLTKAWSQTLLTDTAKLDESIKLCSHFDGIQDAIDHMVADCKASSSANTFLQKYCGIILDNIDTGAITGWDAGGSSVKTAAGVVPEDLSTLQHLGNYKNASFVRNGVTIKISSTGDSLTADGKKVFDGLYSWWAAEALELVEESYGVSFTANDTINIALTPNATYRALTSGNTVTINAGGVTFEDTEDYNGNGVDRTIAHEFTHIAQNFFLGYFPQFLQEGLADLTCGIDDKRTHYINALAGNADSLSAYLDLETSGTGSAFHYAAGYMFYRYLARQASNSYDSSAAHAWEDNVSISGSNMEDDFLAGNGSNQTLWGGAGNDTLTSYGDGSKVLGGAGNDYLLTKGNNLSAIGGLGDDSLYNSGSSSTISLGDGDDYVRNDGGSVTVFGGAGSDSVDNRGSGVFISSGTEDDSINNYGSNVSISAGDGDDDILNLSDRSMLYGGSGHDFIQNGVFIAREDHGSSNGGDLVTISAGSGNDYLLNRIGQFVLLDAGSGDDNIVNNGGDLVTIDAGSGDDTIINQTASLVADDSDANASDGADNVLIDAGDGNDLIRNWGAFVTIRGGAGNDTLSNGGDGLTIDYRAGDGNDSIVGFNVTTTLQIDGGAGTYSTQISGSDVLVTVEDATITLSGAASLDTLHIDGAVQTRLILDNTSDKKITLGSSIELVDASNRSKTLTVVGNALNNTIVGGSGNDQLLGGGGNDSIVGGKGADKIWGGKGDDTLSGGTGNDTLNGGSGTDLFVYSAGKDVISDYASEDRISLGAAITSATVNGSDAVLGFSGGRTLTIVDGKGKTLQLIDSDGTELETIISGLKTVTLTDNSSAKINLPSTYISADASRRNKAITLVGNKLDNTIVGGSGNDLISGGDGADSLLGGGGNDKLWGGKGDDTLWGGAGNDTLIGGDGSDTFLYAGGDGKDVISGFDDSDMLQITGTFTTAYVASDNAIYFRVGSTYRSVTLKDFTASSFNINGETYQIVGNKLRVNRQVV